MTKKRDKREELKRRRGRPSGTKYDEKFKIDATPEDVGRALVTTSPKDVKEWRQRRARGK